MGASLDHTNRSFNPEMPNNDVEEPEQYIGWHFDKGECPSQGLQRNRTSRIDGDKRKY